MCESVNCRLENPADLVQARLVYQAFILGAGLGTRLRPLTDRLPKPLVPLFHRPLAEWAVEACARAGIRRFAINTHHLPEAWDGFGEEACFPPVVAGNGLCSRSRTWHGMELSLFHEPDLLETGGGLKNIEPWMGDQPLLVHNGDIFSSMALDQLIAAHEASGLPATLALRSGGAEKRISVDDSRTRVTDLRSQLLNKPGSHVFTGIYCVNPEVIRMLPPGEKIQIIPAFLELAKQGRLGAIVLDEGEWLDLGDRDSYLHAHRSLALGPLAHPQASIAHPALVENSAVGPGAVVEEDCVVRNSVLWPGARILSGAHLDGCVVFSGHSVSGVHQAEDL